MAYGYGSGRRGSKYVDPYEDWASEESSRGFGPAHIWSPDYMNWYTGPQYGWRDEPTWVTNIDADTEPLWGMPAASWPPTGPYTGVGPRNYRRSDERILEDVSERLMQNGDIDASNISVNVSAGQVDLQGTLNTRREKRLAEYIAGSVPGVMDVDNQLRVRNTWRM